MIMKMPLLLQVMIVKTPTTTTENNIKTIT
jgi:hypothetical protein